MTYTEVSDILEKDDEKLKKTFAKQVDDFKNAEKLARILMKRRQRRGAIDFDFPEAKIILNEKVKLLISNIMKEEYQTK